MATTEQFLIRHLREIVTIGWAVKRMKQDLKLIFLVLVGATTLLLLLPGISAAHLPVPYFDQRLAVGPLTWSEMAYLRRLAELEDGSLEVTTSSTEADGSDAWDNSCVSEAVNSGGFSMEEETKESDETIQEDV